MAIDPVKSAEMVLLDPKAWMPFEVAMARVILAASERVKSGHDESCEARAARHGGRCTCGHDALVKALRGEQ